MQAPAPVPAQPSPALPPRDPVAVAWLVAGAYAVVAALWFLGTNTLVTRWVADHGTTHTLAALADWAFVVLSALLFGAVAHRHLRRQQRLLQRERAAVAAEASTAGLMQALADGSPDAIFAKDRQGRYLMFNREAARVTGVAAADVIGRDDRDVFPAEQAAQIRRNDDAVMAQDHPATFEEALDTADGPLVYLATKGPLHDARGQVVGMFGISRDITELARAREALQASEARYRMMFEANPHPMWVYDTATLVFLAVNDAAVLQYGYARDELLRMTVLDIRPEGERQRMRGHVGALTGLAAAARVRLSKGWQHRRRDGTLFEVEVTANDLEYEGRIARLVLAMDVTERTELERQREAALAETQAAHDRLRDVLARIDDGFVALDRDWRYSYVNQRAAEMLGRAAPADLLGRHIWTEFPEGEGQRFKQAYEEAMATQQPKVLEAHFEPWDRWFENRIYPSPDGLTIYFTDISERKRAERDLALRDAELRHSEMRYRLAAAGGQVWDWDFVAGRETVPGTFWAQLGIELPAEDQALATFEALIHPDDRGAWRDAMREHLVRRAPYRLSFRMRHADGRWRWFLTQGQATWDAQGRAVYMAGTTFDISGRKAVEQALRESEAYRRTVVEQLADGVLVLDAGGAILDANPAAHELLAYPPGALLERRLPDLLTPADRARLPASTAALTVGRTAVGEWEHLRRDGSHFPAEVSVRLMADGRLVSVLRDVSQRRHAEQQSLRYQMELSELTRRLLAQEQAISRRVAQSLHDHLGQTLASARWQLDAAMASARGALPPALQTQCDRLSPLLERAVQEVREVLVDLRPPLLETQGLAAALDNELRQADAAGAAGEHRLEVGDEAQHTRWPDDVEYAAFMIAREAIANAQRHAQAGHLSVRLQGGADRLWLEVADDGVGFASTEPALRPGHLGLVGMRERAIGIGARLEIASRPGGGTEARLSWQRIGA